MHYIKLKWIIFKSHMKKSYSYHGQNQTTFPILSWVTSIMIKFFCVEILLFMRFFNYSKLIYNEEEKMSDPQLCSTKSNRVFDQNLKNEKWIMVVWYEDKNFHIVNHIKNLNLVLSTPPTLACKRRQSEIQNFISIYFFQVILISVF